MTAVRTAPTLAVAYGPGESDVSFLTTASEDPDDCSSAPIDLTTGSSPCPLFDLFEKGVEDQSDFPGRRIGCLELTQAVVKFVEAVF